MLGRRQKGLMVCCEMSKSSQNRRGHGEKLTEVPRDDCE